MLERRDMTGRNQGQMVELTPPFNMVDLLATLLFARKEKSRIPSSKFSFAFLCLCPGSRMLPASSQRTSPEDEEQYMQSYKCHAFVSIPQSHNSLFLEGPLIPSRL